jgi:hypothetical protein
MRMPETSMMIPRDAPKFTVTARIVAWPATEKAAVRIYGRGTTPTKLNGGRSIDPIVARASNGLEGFSR